MSAEEIPLVELRNVSLVYGDDDDELLAIQDLSLTVAKGEFVAVVGPSGCGKSSLMKLATGLLPATAGTVAFEGRRVTAPLAGVGMAFQNSTLMPWRTTLRNVMLPFEIAEPYKHELRQRNREFVERAERLLATVGLGSFGSRFPWQLSGGMQQRVSLCRALIHEPALLMLDEPFGALDAFTKEDLWGVLQALWLDRRCTTILVTHDLREAVFLADRVFVIGKRPGRVVFTTKIDLPRPRTLEDSFKGDFVALVHELRNRIAEEQTP
jgi:NitT/TauT family transport system ATP-binding protein